VLRPFSWRLALFLKVVVLALALLNLDFFGLKPNYKPGIWAEAQLQPGIWAKAQLQTWNLGIIWSNVKAN